MSRDRRGDGVQVVEDSIPLRGQATLSRQPAFITIACESGPRPESRTVDAVMNILFVCYGCTCRSPIAAAIARHALGPTHHVAAAGVRPASAVDERAIAVLGEMNLDTKGLRRLAVKDVNFDEFDLIIALSEAARQRLMQAGAKRLRLWKIRDPYYGQIETYRKTAAALQKRIARLQKELT